MARAIIEIEDVTGGGVEVRLRLSTPLGMQPSPAERLAAKIVRAVQETSQSAGGALIVEGAPGTIAAVDKLAGTRERPRMPPRRAPRGRRA